MTDARRIRVAANECGMTRPYRQPPADFRETYLRMGWDGIEEHYGTNYRCIARWIEQCGGDELRAARSAVTGLPQRKHNRSKRYVMGRTLTGVTGKAVAGAGGEA